MKLSQKDLDARAQEFEEAYAGKGVIICLGTTFAELHDIDGAVQPLCGQTLEDCCLLAAYYPGAPDTAALPDEYKGLPVLYEEAPSRRLL